MERSQSGPLRLLDRELHTAARHHERGQLLHGKGQLAHIRLYAGRGTDGWPAYWAGTIVCLPAAGASHAAATSYPFVRVMKRSPWYQSGCSLAPPVYVADG